MIVYFFNIFESNKNQSEKIIGLGEILLENEASLELWLPTNI
jgi:hypothetical protein